MGPNIWYYNIMLTAVLVILILLWLLGYGPLQVLTFPLYRWSGHLITLWDALIFLVMIYLIGSLPRPLKEIASVLLILWILSLFGIIAIAGLSNILVLSLIIGLIIYILSNK